MIYKSGDIFVTRNKDESLNKMPGYWNHIALYTKYGIIEAQMPPINSVICSDIPEFTNRYYKWQVYRYNMDDITKLNIVNNAIRLIGKPYSMANSLWYKIFGLHFGRKFNCVSLIRYIYEQNTKDKFNWTIPDDITNDKKLTLITEKNDI